MLHRIFITLFCLVISSQSIFGQKPIDVLIISGQNNHYWPTSSEMILKIFENNALFNPTLVLSPPKGEDMTGFSPDFKDYDVVCLDYNGDEWPEKTRKNFVKFVKKGGGVVVVHAANNAFPQWTAYNEIIGLGGWGGRTESDGPYVYVKDGEVVRDNSPGKGGAHGKGEPYLVRTFKKDHPVMKGLPEAWMHAKDELYHSLRGPALNMEVLAVATQSKESGGTGRDEPVLFTIDYGKGKVFHTVMGDVWKNSFVPLQCSGFITTLLRGSEWTATGKVTQEVPDSFPGTEEPILWPELKAPE